jgi:segregation and condensation protein B
MSVPVPSDADALREDEDPLDRDDLFQEPLEMHQTETGEE